MITIIAAIDSKNGIGKNNDLLFRIKEDLQNFKKVTTGNTVVMGRKTYESIGKPLPNRENVVLSRDSENIFRFMSHVDLYPGTIEGVIKHHRENNHKNIFIIGGAQIYVQTMQYADKLLITKVEGDFEADTFFPEIKENKFQLMFESETKTDEKTGLKYKFLEYTRY